jgi:hypothetical protein
MIRPENIRRHFRWTAKNGTQIGLIKGLSATLLMLTSATTKAACLDEYQALLTERYGGYEPTQHETVCKRWPATGLLILATAIKTDVIADLDLVIIDPSTKSIVATTREKEILDAGAINSHGVTIDTANYRLDKNHVAFGIRTSWKGSSQPNPYSSTSLSLYSLCDNGLNNVLEGLTVQERVGEWDTRCAGSFQERHLTLAMRQSRDNYADIVVRETVRNTSSFGGEGSCETTTLGQKTKSYTLKYKQGYAVPENLKSLNYK